MKATLILAAAALARVAYAFPIQDRDFDDVDDIGDDECGAPEPEPTVTSSASTTIASILSSSAAAISSSSEVPVVSPTSAASPSSSESSSPAPSSGSASKNTGSGPNPYTSNGIKAGLSGFVGIATNDQGGFGQLAAHIGWYSDYSATTPTSGNVVGIPMLWGDGQACLSDTNNAQRLQQFQSNTSSFTPSIMMGFYEPDCDCPMSSDISDPTTGAQKWNDLIAPLGKKGTVLGSPSMCKQKAEDWLGPFLQAGAADWDVTNIHVNKNSLQGVQEDIEYYVSTYGKNVWVAELACVDDTNGFTPCSDQGEINNFINDVIPWLQANESVVAYGPSNGEGLGDNWPLFTGSGDLSATGQAYLSALQNLKI